MLTNGCRQSHLRSAVIRVVLIEVKPNPLLILKVYGNKRIILMPLSSSLVTKYRSQLHETLVSFFQSLVAVLADVSVASGCSSAPTLPPFLFPQHFGAVWLLFFICKVVFLSF